MAAPPARARADYDYLIKLLLIGDSGWFPQFQIVILRSFRESREFVWRIDGDALVIWGFRSSIRRAVILYLSFISVVCWF